MMSLNRPAKLVKHDKAAKSDRDPYVRLLNSRIEALLSSGSKISGVLMEVSPYAIMLEN
jgi:small nuclear ribonucleoprotein (snRNP)-like protein